MSMKNKPYTQIENLDAEGWNRQHKEISLTLRVMFRILLVTCLFCAITVVGAPDIAVITGTHSIPLPFGVGKVPFSSFTIAGPLLMIGVLIYSHIFISLHQRLESSLPVSGQDDLYRLPYIFNCDGFFSRFLTYLVFYMLVPISILVFSARTTSGSMIFHHIINIILSVVFLSLTLTHLAKLWKRVNKVVSVFILIAYISVFFICSIWIANFTRILDFSEANLSNVNLKKVDVKGASFHNANLTDANLSEINLANADLRGADLTNANVTGADLRKTKLNGANLTNANLTKAKLTFANLTGADLTGVNLTKVIIRSNELDRAILIKANFAEADLRGANITSANLTSANFVGAKLAGTNLINTNLKKADLRGVDLVMAQLGNADLTEAILKKVTLTRADLRWANLTRVDFRGADLRWANLTKSKFIETNLKPLIPMVANKPGIPIRTNLTGADFTEADLTGADFTEANLLGADLTNAIFTDAIFLRADLTGGNLTGASLHRADLTEADLTDAILIGADLTDVNLTDAILLRADLTGARFAKSIISLTRGSASTILPQEIAYPDTWLTAAQIKDRDNCKKPNVWKPYWEGVDRCSPMTN